VYSGENLKTYTSRLVAPLKEQAHHRSARDVRACISDHTDFNLPPTHDFASEGTTRIKFRNFQQGHPLSTVATYLPTPKGWKAKLA
jgi:hypothetical protein